MQRTYKTISRAYTAVFILTAVWYNIDMLTHVPHQVTRVVMVAHAMMNVCVLLFVLRNNERTFEEGMRGELKLLGVIQVLVMLPVLFFSFEGDAVFFLSITFWILSFVTAALLKHSNKTVPVAASKSNVA